MPELLISPDQNYNITTDLVNSNNLESEEQFIPFTDIVQTTQRPCYVLTSSPAFNSNSVWVMVNGQWVQSTINSTSTCPSSTSSGIICYYSSQTSTTSSFYDIRDHTGYYPSVKPKVPFIHKSTRNSIKRALALLSRIGMEKEAFMFVRGDKIEIANRESLFKFVIQRRNYKNLIAATEHQGHAINFKLELWTKKDQYIASLCLYSEGCGILDQIAMLAMYIRSGNELDLLKKANFNFYGSSHLKDIDETVINQLIGMNDRVKETVSDILLLH